jgi:phosphatidylglycerophosphate synthase
MIESTSATARRPLTSRNSAWAAACAQWCVKAGFSPNTISVASIFFGAAACAIFTASGVATDWAVPLFLISGALMVQGRLLCNLLDGMVAIEGGKKTKSGEIFNELPDRIADPIILIGAGYCVNTTPWLGWMAALLALLTAYVRALGVAAGASQQFCGPMAKPHRMATVTIAAVVLAIVCWMRKSTPVMSYALDLICIGCVVTIVRRTMRIVAELEAK